MQLNNEEIKKVISKNIKSKRISSDLKQAVVAEMSNISIDFLSNVERGISSISLVNLVNICHALNITPNDVLRDFFICSCDMTESLLTKLNTLSDYEKKAVLTLVDFYIENNKDNP